MQDGTEARIDLQSGGGWGFPKAGRSSLDPASEKTREEAEKEDGWMRPEICLQAGDAKPFLHLRQCDQETNKRGCYWTQTDRKTGETSDEETRQEIQTFVKKGWTFRKKFLTDMWMTRPKV